MRAHAFAYKTTEETSDSVHSVFHCNAYRLAVGELFVGDLFEPIGDSGSGLRLLETMPRFRLDSYLMFDLQFETIGRIPSSKVEDSFEVIE